MMNVAVDAMGGDYAPGEIIEGAILAASRFSVRISLVGLWEQLAVGQDKAYFQTRGVDLISCTQVVEMTDQPMTAVRQKPDSSLAVAVSLLRDGKAKAMVSAGNTGATLAFALLGLGRLPGVSRPAIALPMPTLGEVALVIDGGANVEVKPEYLLQFAHMGSIYMKDVLGRPKPKVGLLNIGTEEEKGTPTLQEAYRLLSNSDLNFIGNIEGREFPRGVADVVVTDGFSGNLLLKLTEGLAMTITEMLRREIMAAGPLAKLGAYFSRRAYQNLKSRLDYEQYGGAQLLGLKHPVVIAHGSSKAEAICNAIGVAKEAVEQEIPAKISAIIG